LTARGHAIEARIYAEDPARDFLPQAGPLLLYREPRLPGVRVDAGVVEGGEVPVHYDPMLAKVIAYGETRDVAITRLVAALRQYPILGVRTNISFLINVLDHPNFRAADVDTGFLDREGSTLAEPQTDGPPAFLRDALAHLESGVRAGADRLEPGASDDPWVHLRDWRL
jgi:3-methylcrotonyl-CoA carboxylase alpha subunit